MKAEHKYKRDLDNLIAYQEYDDHGAWRRRPPGKPTAQKATKSDTVPDWTTPCDVCDAVPTLPATGMCGPCTFGEAETAGGNW